MSSTSSPAGTVLARPAVTVLDTREMPWEGTEWVLPRALHRVLSRDDEGDGVVYQRFLTAWTPDPGISSSGYRLAHEQYLCLEGEFSHHERGLDGADDELITFREGVWMDRAPGSLTSGVVDVPVGVKGLGWMVVQDDAYVGLGESAALVRELPHPERAAVDPPPSGGDRAARHDPAAGVRLVTDFVRVVDAREMSWEDHPLLPGARLKALSRRADGDPTVAIVGIPAGRYPAEALPWRGTNDFRELTYVLEGELRVREYDGPDDDEGTPLVLREGYWVDRRPGSVFGFDAGECTPSGVTYLTVRLRDDTTLVKERDKYVGWTRTLNAGTRSPSPVSTLEELHALRAARRSGAGA
jgi:hypothetical protein